MNSERWNCKIKHICCEVNCCADKMTNFGHDREFGLSELINLPFLLNYY